MGAVSDLSGKNVYLDANVFIYALNAFPGFSDAIERLFKAAEAGHLLLRTSELSIAEILVVPFRAGNAAAERECRLLLESDGLELSGITQGILETAARLRAANRSLRLPDAIHVATAMVSKCDVVLTNDQRLKASQQVLVMLLSEMV